MPERYARFTSFLTEHDAAPVADHNGDVIKNMPHPLEFVCAGIKRDCPFLDLAGAAARRENSIDISFHFLILVLCEVK